MIIFQIYLGGIIATAAILFRPFLSSVKKSGEPEYFGLMLALAAGFVWPLVAYLSLTTEEEGE